MKYTYDTFSTPLGEFSAAVDQTGAVIATAFGGVQKLQQRFDGHGLVRDQQAVAAVRREVEEFFAGERTQFTVRLAPRGTEFQLRVWSALRQIPIGETLSYGQLANRLGKPLAARAVGRANAANPICLLVPCHRVIGKSGDLTGFAFGMSLKQKLIEHETALAAAATTIPVSQADHPPEDF